MTYAVRRLFRDDCASGGIVARPGLMIARTFVNALARRLSLVIVAGALAWMGVGSARAANCDTTADACDEGQALAAAWQYARSVVDPNNAGSIGVPCVVSYPGTKEHRGGALPKTMDCNSPLAGSTLNLRKSFYYRSSCDKRPDWNGPYPYLAGGIPRNGSVTCNDGCKQAWYSTGDGYFNGKYTSVSGTCNSYDDNKCKAEFGAGYYWNGAMSSCEPEEGKCTGGAKPNSLGECKPEPCPEGKVQNADGTCENKKNECPAGNVKAPSGECLPGEGQCAAGEAKGKDGTCKRDSNGDGKPDSEDGEDDPNKDSASGGENCNSPPSCNGNPIMCLQLRTQWRIDCNTRNDRNVSGGACGAMPVCVGKDCNAQEHAQLIQQWKAACALDKLANKSGGDDGGQPEWTKVGGMNQNPGSGELASDKPAVGEKSFNTDDLDQSGFGGGSCIGLATVSGQGVVGSSYAQTFASPPAAWCNFISNLRASLIIISAALSCFIIARGL